MESLREQGEGVRLLLLHRRRVGVRFAPPPLLVQRFAGGGERLHEQSTHLGGQPPLDPDSAGAVRIHVQRPARVLESRLPGLGLVVHSSPAAHDPRDMLGRSGPAHRQQPRFGFRRGDARQLTDLGV